MPASDRSGKPRNPYLNRVMIREVSDFFGRRREAAKIFARIGASRPQSVAIVGERRIGKSSLLNYLCQPEIRRQYLDDPDAYTFVLIDLQEQRDIGIPAFFENLFRGIEGALGRERPPGLPADYETARRALVRLQDEGRKIVLLFDEFDAITRNPNFPEEFFSFLRAVANKYDVAYVTTSGRDLQQLCHAERIADSPFFNIFSNLFLTRFEPDDALALVREPSKTAGLPLEPYAADIIGLAGLFPFFIQMACSAFFEELAERGQVDVQRAQTSFREEAEPHFNYILEHLDADHRRVLADLVHGRLVPPSHSYLLGKLRRDGYLLEQHGRERLFSSVFAVRIAEAGRQREGRASTPPAGRGGEGELQSPGPALVGRHIGAFQIVSLVGAGGMGQVYRARDLTLERDVAIKLLPDAFAADPERLARFEREARVLAALNHPSIAAIYGLAESDGLRGLILEFVDGPTLSERISGQAAKSSGRGLEIKEAFWLARQIASALEAAHAKGIVHRDLKPANIKVAPGEMVKVLDFGLAKVWARESAGSEVSQLVTRPATGTVAGVILGTPAYMSPEQARGKSLDKRTDIWSFGCILLEMLTGLPAFTGETHTDTLARILEREPDWQALPASIPPRARALLRRCLQKDPNLRLHDIADVRIELDELLAEQTPDRRARGFFSRLARRIKPGSGEEA